MIRVIPYRTPGDAARRLEFQRVPREGVARLLDDLRPYLLRIPEALPGAREIAGAVAARGIPVAEGDHALFFSVSSPRQVDAWTADDAARGTVLRPVSEALRRWLVREFDVACRDRMLPLGGGPLLMGILNVTPDSFSDGGRYACARDAIRRGEEMAAQGAAIIDVGGESTRPGAAPVPEREQIRRVLPVVRGLAESCPALLSIDTTSAAVAEAAIEAGARIVNDTSALRDDPRMASVVRESGCAVVLMHRKGVPATMQAAPTYDSLFDEMLSFFEERLAAAQEAGIARERILVDPGIGFGKRPGDNLALNARLDELANTGRPIVFGPSRKAFLGVVTGRPVGERVFATAASVACAVLARAHVLRVHDVREMRDAALVAHAVGSAPEC